VQQTAIKKYSRLEAYFNRVVKKYRDAGLYMAADFLESKARRSIKTSLAFSSGLEHLNAYTKSRYSMDIEQIVPSLVDEKIDVYSLLNSFVTYLQKETKNGYEMVPGTIVDYLVTAKSYFMHNFRRYGRVC
jgi:hypothetical protein